MNKEILNAAHVRESDMNIQPLEVHLRNTGELAERFMQEIGVQDTGMLIGLLHDIGKVSGAFNTYIRSESGIFKEDDPEYKKYVKGSIDHSTAGAQYLLEKCGERSATERVVVQMLELAIMSHHSGLIDCLSNEGKDKFTERLKKSQADTGYSEFFERINKDLTQDIEKHMNSGIRSVSKIIEDISKEQDKERVLFRIGLLTRFILSCLVDADRIDTRSFEDQNTICESASDVVPWDILLNRFYEKLPKCEGHGINRIRADVSEQCFNASSRPKGVYTLSVPTGGGKTLSSLRFAMEHLRARRMKRIFYIIPYTSIIDQNVKVVRKYLENEEDKEIFVLEHHSNMDLDQDEGSEAWSRGASENWDSPIVFTTLVQFMDAIFSSGTGNARRMHNLANSVIVFDEIQSLPVKLVYLFNEAINFLSNVCGSTVVLCTATQPLLGSKKLKHPLNLSKDHEIVEKVDELFNDLNRVDIFFENKEQTYEGVIQLVTDKLSEYNSVLLIANTKSSVAKLFEAVKGAVESSVNIFHLSTNMCPKHRSEVLEKIDESLDEGRKTVCVSTQLIEAGIDIDFNVVIRSMAGIDSIAQAAGRCNRHAEMPEKGEVHIIQIKENTGRLKDIYEGIGASEVTLCNCDDVNLILNPRVIESYYETYFYNRKGDMVYRTGDKSNLFSKLSLNSSVLEEYKRINKTYPPNIMLQSFKEANSLFSVIDNRTHPVIVPYDKEGEEIIVALCSDDQYKITRELLRKAQRYSINVYESQLNGLLMSGSVKDISRSSDQKVYCLVDGNYDKEYGLKEGAEMKMLVS